MPIDYTTGDATAPVGPGNRIIGHICNDVGGWGQGFVLALSRRWKAPEAEYGAWYTGRADNDFGLGAVQLVAVEDTVWVANMVGQTGLVATSEGPPIRYDAVERALATLAERATRVGASVHLPRIGCGLAGGTWEEIEPILDRTLGRSGVPVTVYDFG